MSYGSGYPGYPSQPGQQPPANSSFAGGGYPQAPYPQGGGPSKGYPAQPSTGYPGAPSAHQAYPQHQQPQRPQQQQYPPQNTSFAGSGYPAPSAASSGSGSGGYPTAPSSGGGYPQSAQQPITALGTAPPAPAPAPAPAPVPSPAVPLQQNQQQQQPPQYSMTLADAAASVVNSSSRDKKFPPADPNQPLDPYEYLRPRGFTDDMILAARAEHVDTEPDMCMDDIELKNYGGTAIFAFYKFLKFIGIMMFFLFCLSIINYGMFAGKFKPVFQNNEAAKQAWYDDFFITRYSQDQRSAWLGTTVVSVIIMFFACPYYYRYIGGYTFEGENITLAEQENLASEQGHADDAIIRFQSDGSIDVSARYRSFSNIFLRRLFSLGVFGAFIVIQVFASIYITKIESDSSSSTGSFAVAFIAALLNITYTLIARQMTEVEKLQTQGSADKSLTLKLVLFKLANVIAVYGAKTYPDDRCIYSVIGEQFLTLLFVEIIFVTPLTMIGAALLTYFHEYYGAILGSFNGDARHVAQFEMAIEYLANLYKFYLGCMALVVFPMSTVLSVFALTSEYWAGRYRLIKIRGKPVQSMATMRGTITAVMMLIFFATLFTPYAGAVFIWARWSLKRMTATGALQCGNFPAPP